MIWLDKQESRYSDFVINEETTRALVRLFIEVIIVFTKV